MKLYSNIVCIYDIEMTGSYVNILVENTEVNKDILICFNEKSDNVRQIGLLKSVFLHKNIIMCGFNNSNLDNIVINYIIDNAKTLERDDNERVISKLNALYKYIVDLNFKDSLKWRKIRFFNSIDLSFKPDENDDFNEDYENLLTRYIILQHKLETIMTNEEVIHNFIERKFCRNNHLESLSSQLFTYDTILAEWFGDEIAINNTYYSTTSSTHKNILIRRCERKGIKYRLVNNILKNSKRIEL